MPTIHGCAKSKLANCQILQRARCIPELTGVSHDAVYEIVKHYQTEREGDNDPTKLVRAPNFLGNFSNKPSRIPHGNAMYCMVRDYVGSKRQIKQRVTAVQVLQHLQDENAVKIKNENGVMCEKNRGDALRALRAYLQRKGFHRGRRTDYIRIIATTKWLEQIICAFCSVTEIANHQKGSDKFT